MRKMKKLVIVTVPFHGHTDILEIVGNHLRHLDIYFLITGWTDVHLRKRIPNSYEICRIPIEGASPGEFTLPRVKANIRDVIDIVHQIDPDLIIYDFFALEGYIAGKTLGIPTICSIPAILPFEEDK